MEILQPLLAAAFVLEKNFSRRAAGIIIQKLVFPTWHKPNSLWAPPLQQRMELYARTSMQPSSTTPTWPSGNLRPANGSEWKQVCKDWPNMHSQQFHSR